MSRLDKQLYLIRQVGTDQFEAGYGAYAVPKLYSKSSAFSVVSKKNRDARENDERNERLTAQRGGDTSSVGKWPRYEAVPVTVTIGEVE